MDDLPEHDGKGILTARQREYLNDPEGFKTSKGTNAASQVRSNIRTRYRAAVAELEYLEENLGKWQNQKVGGADIFTEERSAVFDGNHPFEESKYDIHQQISEESTITIPIHEQTHESLNIVRNDIDELIYERLQERSDVNEDIRKLQEKNPDRLVSYNDVIRLALLYSGDLADVLARLEKDHDYLSLDQLFGEGALDMVEAFRKAIQKTGLQQND